MTDSAAAILITMPHSHYSEKARWALDWLELPYREEPHVPLMHTRDADEKVSARREP